MKKKEFLPAEQIHYGDIIAIDAIDKMGLVYAVVKSAEDNTVTSFKIIPIFIHDMSFSKKNDSQDFMMPHAVKLELALQATKQYRVHFVIEDFSPNPNHQVFRYAKASASTFAGRSIARMDNQIKENNRFAEVQAANSRTFIFHKETATHVKERALPGKVMASNITLEDARQHEIISETLYQALSRGKYGHGKQISMLREAFELANSPKATCQEKIISVLHSGLLSTDVSLRQAFTDSVLFETASFNKFRDMNINRLSAAMVACGANQGKKVSSMLEEIDAYDIHHIRTQPIISLAAELSAAWRLFNKAVAEAPEQLESAGLRFMYPV